jgi:N6-adenosine-specific RNA methylase IME4
VTDAACIEEATGEILVLPSDSDLQRYQTDMALVALSEEILEVGKTELAGLSGISSVRDRRAKAAAIDAYLRRTMQDREMKVDARNNLTELVLRYERQLGRWLKVMPKNKGGNPLLTATTVVAVATIADLHITDNQSSRWQKRAAVPDDVFEDICARAREERWELSGYDLDRWIHDQAVQRTIRRAQKNALQVPDGVYNVVYADPAWKYRNTGLDGAAHHHYDTVTTEDIYSLLDAAKIQVADHAVLFMWATNPFLAEALECVRRWGFEYKTNIAWVKTDLKKPGVGWYVRGRHELLLIATRGSFTPLDGHLSPPIGSVLEAPVQAHSRKPEDVYTIIERLYPDCNYIELFARRSRTGWESVGDEVDD